MYRSTKPSKAQSSELAQTSFIAMILNLYRHCKLLSALPGESIHIIAGMRVLDLVGTNPSFTATPQLCQGLQSLPPVMM